MSEKVEFVLRAIMIGAGATLVMDAWAFVLRQLGIPSLNFAFLGRWLAHGNRAGRCARVGGWYGERCNGIAGRSLDFRSGPPWQSERSGPRERLTLLVPVPERWHLLSVHRLTDGPPRDIRV